MIIEPILTMSRIHVSLKRWENVLFELGSEGGWLPSLGFISWPPSSFLCKLYFFVLQRVSDFEGAPIGFAGRGVWHVLRCGVRETEAERETRCGP